MKLKEEKLGKITFEIAKWKILFYEYIGGKLNLEEFEKELYERSDLESSLEEDIYLDLISFDYKNKLNSSKVINYILEKILIGETEYDCKLYILIRVFYESEIEKKINNSKNLPEAVISIFKNSYVKGHWLGVKNPSCDLQFLSSVKNLNRTEEDCRNFLPLDTVIIGYAHNSDIEVLMDNDGVVYLYLNIIDELYLGGDFFEALIKLFFGLDYGNLLCPERNR